MMKKCTLTLMLLGAMLPLHGMAAKTAKLSYDNSKIPSPVVESPMALQADMLDEAGIIRTADSVREDMKRRPASSKSVGSADMMSDEYKTFVAELIAAKTGDEFGAVIRKYDAKYDSIPASANDLKYTVARLATWLPLKSVIWRMVPMVHQVVTTQQVLLTTLYNVAEQIQINLPDGHVESQMLYLTMPTADMVGKQFYKESDFMGFLAREMYPTLMKSIKRLEAIKMANISSSGRETPIVFDARIRFGENAFTDRYDDFERFKIISSPERLATIARLHRRLYSISMMNAYNWNGHFALRRKIGREFGMGVAESALFDTVPGSNNPYVKGVNRKTRIQVIREFPDLYTLQPNGKDWMQVAYYHLHSNGVYLGLTWNLIKDEDSNTVAQIDPEIFMARKDQVELGIMNLKKLTAVCGSAKGANFCDKNRSGKTIINGGVSGQSLAIDLKGFYDSPPRDLKALLPTGFVANEDLLGLTNKPEYASLKEVARDSDMMQMSLNGKKVMLRNYSFGRSASWDISNKAYGTLFPELKDGKQVAEAMRVLNETRGVKFVGNGLTMFIR